MPTATDPLIIVNATPLISLDACNQIELLRSFYARVVVPDAVEKELRRGGRTALPSGITPAHRAWIDVLPLSTPPSAALLAALDRGEAEVIALALELGCPRVVLDEQEARSVAIAMGLQVVGTMGILLRAKKSGEIPAVKPCVDDMVTKGIWLKQKLIDFVLRQAGELV